MNELSDTQLQDSPTNTTRLERSPFQTWRAAPSGIGSIIEFTARGPVSGSELTYAFTPDDIARMHAALFPLAATDALELVEEYVTRHFLDTSVGKSVVAFIEGVRDVR